MNGESKQRVEAYVALRPTNQSPGTAEEEFWSRVLRSVRLDLGIKEANERAQAMGK